MSEAVHHVANMLPFKIALIGSLGIGAQWLAWRLQRPAIVLMSIAGLIFGPFIGWLLSMGMPDVLHDTLDMFWLDPVNDFGDVYRPMIGIAVAIILFEVLLNGTAMFNHANLRLPLPLDRVLRALLVTPDMHRVHHSVHRHEHDSNYGFSLSVWDRLFRTYIAQPGEGHDDMTIGLSWQDERPAKLGWSLWLPFSKR